MKCLLGLTVAIVVAIAVGCENKKPPSGSGSHAGPGPRPGPAPAAAGAKMSSEDFVAKAASSGLYEVESSKLVLEKSPMGHEAAAAQMMIDDHTKANDELKQIADQKKITVPAAMNAKDQGNYDALAKLEGEELDKAYHKQQVDAHHEAIELFTAASTGLEDAELKQFAAKTLPTLQKHHDHLEEHKHE